MYRKGLGPSNLPGLDENPDYTCPDEAELPLYLMLSVASAVGQLPV